MVRVTSLLEVGLSSLLESELGQKWSKPRVLPVQVLINLVVNRSQCIKASVTMATCQQSQLVGG